MWVRTAEAGTFKVEKDYTKTREIMPERSGWYIVARGANNSITLCYYDEFSDFWWNDEIYTEIK